MHTKIDTLELLQLRAAAEEKDVIEGRYCDVVRLLEQVAKFTAQTGDFLDWLLMQDRSSTVLDHAWQVDGRGVVVEGMSDVELVAAWCEHQEKKEIIRCRKR